MSDTDARETVGKYIALDWYDGPLLEIAPVDFADGDRMVQVCSLCTVHEVETPPADHRRWSSARLRGTISGDHPWERSVVRLTRSDLQKMLDLLDGKPVKNYFDE